MTYSGDVKVGGPADARELRGLTIHKLAVGPMDNNAYLLVDGSSGEGLLIDAANEAERLLQLVGDVPLATVVTTHRHGDHWQALAAVTAATGARTVAHPLDAPELPVPVAATVGHGDTVSVGSSTLSVVHLRGHTPGSIALAYEDPADGVVHLFTGDSLFPGGPGRTTSPEDFTSLMDDLEARVFGVFGDDTWFYPGHGNDSTLGAERPSVPEWRSRGW
ncbi:MAG TPA: MBL fold metallo-hydrolase [Mycobacteriales bacterium]|nr:MBL fold metallo-hydrolase [Mycobacteriales bacterium]